MALLQSVALLPRLCSILGSLVCSIPTSLEFWCDFWLRLNFFLFLIILLLLHVHTIMRVIYFASIAQEFLVEIKYLVSYIDMFLCFLFMLCASKHTCFFCILFSFFRCYECFFFRGWGIDTTVVEWWANFVRLSLFLMYHVSTLRWP